MNTKVDVDEAHFLPRPLAGSELEAYAAHRACRDAVTPAPICLCLKSIRDFAEKKDTPG